MTISRRKIMSAGAGVVASAAVASVAGTAKPTSTTTATTTSANGKPNIAVIGCGGIARFHGVYLKKYLNIVALADVDRAHANTYNTDTAGGKATVAGDYRKVLERNDVDVVLVTTPDHWHSKIV